jgi:phosphatidylglycerophosphate synthase
VTAFGARFDMETDAALTLILATLCCRFDKVGAWILAVGLMRYLFAGFALFVHWIARPLPYSRRRQTIYVLQMSGLLAVMSPLFPVPASSLVGLATLSMLSASFAIDVAWLARHRPR